MKRLPTSNAEGGGGCMLDIDGNGQMDLIALNDGEHAIHVFLNRGDGHFEEVPAKQAGLDVRGNAIACTVGDFDNDGLTDLAVSMNDRVLLFKNLGNGKFADVTAGRRHSFNKPARGLDVRGLRPRRRP